MSEQQAAHRRPWVAALLSLLGGPLGQLYCGRGVRFLVLAGVTFLLLPLVSAIAVSMPESRFAFNALMVAAVCYPVFLIVDAYRVAREATATELQWFQRWWIYPLVLVAFLAAAEIASRLTRSSIAESFYVPSGPMSPTILPGDRILVSKIDGGPDAIEYGDVVVFHIEGPSSPLYVMRVIALGGDRVEIVNESVILNGVKMNDPNATFVGDLPKYPDIANMALVNVPPDCFFVLGDSRRRSMDSRFHGPIPKSDYHGKAVRVFWSRPREVNDRGIAEDIAGPIAWERIGMPIE